MDAVVPIVVESIKCTLCFLFSSIIVFSNFNSHVNALEKEIEKLINRKNIRIKEIELGEGEGDMLLVLVEWLNEVEEVEQTLESLLQQVRKFSEEGAQSHCSCLNSRIFHRYRLSKEVIKKHEMVKRLIDSFNSLPRVLNTASPLVSIELMPVPPLAGREEKLNLLMHYLHRDGVNRIAVWGMGGVGKTTLLRNLNNMLKCAELGLFNIVIWVHVSKDLDLRRVQSDIAARLNYKLNEEENITRRADRLHRRIMKTKNILLILDDLWESIDLDMVGVPQANDLHQIRCKVLLSTRSLRVCREMMADKYINLNVLKEEEAWNLFAEKAGSIVEFKEIKPLAREIVGRCCGLPLAINAMGTYVRGETMIELWSNALNQLRCPTTSYGSTMVQVYEPLKLSYDRLSEQLKSCFLYFSLFPESYSINVSDLITCWIADGLIDDQQTLEDSINNGLALVQSLKDSCLLEEGGRLATVKMHDIVRDVARWTSSIEEERGFFSSSGSLMKHMPPVRLKSSIRRVSFMHNKITKLPSHLPGCSEITVLLLQGNPLKEIHDGFFQEFRALRVLNLGGCGLISLPHSLIQLQEIRYLVLRDCSSLEKLPPLGALCNLQFLDLSGTQVRELPEKMGMLRNLKELNLSGTCHLEGIEAGTFTGLSSLESLDMSFSAFKWDLKVNVGEQEAAFDELLSLEHLSVLHINLDNATCLALDAELFRRLRKFSVWVGPWSCRSSVPPQNNEKRVFFQGTDLMERGIEALLCSASALELVSCGGINGLSELAICGLPNLKFLSVRGCDWIKCFINWEGLEETMLPNLEHLALDGLRNLELIWNGDVPTGACLSRLRTLEVAGCPKLKFLMSFALLNQTKDLEEIKVSSCKRMESLIAGRVPLEALLRLKLIELKHLVTLRTICPSDFKWPNLEILEVSHCPLLHRLPFMACNAVTIKEIRGDLEWWNELLWQDSETKLSLQQRFRACPDNLTLMREHERGLSLEEKILKWKTE